MRTLFFLALSPLLLFAQFPQLDQNFGKSGHFYHYSNLEFSGASGLGLQSDGKIIVGGYHGDSPSQIMRGKLYRLHPNGEVDSTFGVNGFVPDTIIPNTWAIWRLMIQSDDKVVGIGWSDYLKAGLIVRFTANGAIDSAFNQVGYQTVSLSPNSFDSHSLFHVEELSNGKLLLLGDVDINSVGQQVFLIRYLPNGQLDSAYGTNGVAMGFAPPNRELRTRDFVVDDAGNVFLGGTTIGGIGYNPTIVKVDSTGNTDVSFGMSGMLRFPNVGAYLVPDIIMKNTDELILNAESWGPNGYRNLTTIRAFTNGAVDSTYGVNGESTIVLENRGLFSLEKAAMLPDHSIIQCLTKQEGASYRFGLTRILPNGNIDSAFGNVGILLSNLPSTSNYFNIQVLDSVSFIASGHWRDSNSTALLVSKYFLNSYLGVEETSFSRIRIYPNPTAGLIKIHSAIEQEFRIFNQLGQQVWVGKIEVDTENQINLELLPNGVYFLKAESGRTEKLLIQH